MLPSPYKAQNNRDKQPLGNIPEPCANIDFYFFSNDLLRYFVTEREVCYVLRVFESYKWY